MSDASTKKRERIMMSLAGLAVLYLLISFMLPSGKNEAEQPATPPADDILTTIADGLGDLTNEEAARDIEVLALATTPWKNVVFSSQEDFVKATDVASNESLAPAVLSYSGYMVMGKGRMAIINGKDYQQGETVEGYVLKEITPDSVLLEMNGVDARVSIQAPVE